MTEHIRDPKRDLWIIRTVIYIYISLFYLLLEVDIPIQKSRGITMGSMGLAILGETIFLEAARDSLCNPRFQPVTSSGMLHRREWPLRQDMDRYE